MDTALIKINPELDTTVIKLQVEALRLRDYAEGSVVANLEGVKRATEDLSMLTNLKRSLEEKRKEYTQPLNDHLKEINATFKIFSEPLDIADKALRGKILAFNAEQQRIRDEAERAQFLIDQARAIEASLTQQTGEIFPEQTQVVIPGAAPVKKAYTAVGDMSTRKNRKWRELDFSKVPDSYKMLDVTKINRVVRAGIPEIAGIEIYEEDSLVITARRERSAVEPENQE